MSQNDRLLPVDTFKEIGIPVLKVFGVLAVAAAIVVLIIQLLKPKDQPKDQNANPPKSGMGQLSNFSTSNGNWKCHCEK
jgi:hypothetical protein